LSVHAKTRDRQRQLAELARRLQHIWSQETSSDPEHWSSDNPSWGQCAVTALIVQDKFAGELLRTMVGNISHYWNELPGGEEVDLTRQQFGAKAEVGRGELRSRDYVLGFPDTAHRYRLLRERLALVARSSRRVSQ
jgi:hypothetical protein